MTGEADPMWPKIVLILFGWLLGLLSKEFADWISRWIRGPKLRVSFDNKEDCVTLTPENYVLQTGPNTVSATSNTRIVFFSRVRISNAKSRIARRCRAWLTNVEMKQDGQFKPTIFRDSIPLIWSYDAELEYADIPKDITRHVDLIRVQSDTGVIEPQLRSHSGEVLRPLRFEHLFQNHGTFRFTIVVSAEDVAPTETKVVITWDGNWPPKADSET